MQLVVEFLGQESYSTCSRVPRSMPQPVPGNMQLVAEFLGQCPQPVPGTTCSLQ